MLLIASLHGPIVNKITLMFSPLYYRMKKMMGKATCSRKSKELLHDMTENITCVHFLNDYTCGYLQPTLVHLYPTRHTVHEL